MNEKLEAIRQACVKANPEITWNGHETLTFTDRWEHRPIRFSDVLLAVKGEDELTYLDEWGIQVGNYSVGALLSGKAAWNLRADNLIQQSTECIDFLHDLLTPQP